MSDFNFETWLAAVPHESGGEPPTMPVDTAVREARALYDVADTRRPTLADLVTFESSFIDALPVLASKLSDAESEWQRIKKLPSISAQLPVREEAESFRADFLASGRFLLRKNPEALARLDQIAEGSGLDDLAADQGEIARIAEQNPELFAKDRNLPKDIPTYARSLEKKLSASKESPQARAALELRNRIFSLLDDAVGEVRAAGRYLYRKDPRQLAMFGSPYAVRKAKRNRVRNAEPPATPAQEVTTG